MSAPEAKSRKIRIIVTTKGRRQDVTDYCRSQLAEDLVGEWWRGRLEASERGLTDVAADRAAATHVYEVAGFGHRAPGKNPKTVHEYTIRVLADRAQSIGRDPADADQMNLLLDDRVIQARLDLVGPPDDETRDILDYMIQFGAGPAELARQQRGPAGEQLELFPHSSRRRGRRWPGAPTSESGWSRWITRQIAAITARVARSEGGEQV